MPARTQALRAEQPGRAQSSAEPSERAKAQQLSQARPREKQKAQPTDEQGKAQQLCQVRPRLPKFDARQNQPQKHQNGSREYRGCPCHTRDQPRFGHLEQ